MKPNNTTSNLNQCLFVKKIYLPVGPTKRFAGMEISEMTLVLVIYTEISNIS